MWVIHRHIGVYHLPYGEEYGNVGHSLTYWGLSFTIWGGVWKCGSFIDILGSIIYHMGRSMEMWAIHRHIGVYHLPYGEEYGNVGHS